MNPVIKYFTGERAESYLFFVLGLLGLGLGVYLILIKETSFWKGFAIPFILVSVLEIIVGVTLIYRSPKDIVRVNNYIKHEPNKIKTLEIPRMEKVMKNFVVFRYTEIALILVGIITYFAFARLDFWRGLGLGLLLQASTVLTLDYFAERRGFAYIEHLNRIVNE
ncbi:MAG: hypothetical protein RLZZ94_595 [Bacteroidota bacterium]|jgi:hypothetical protein